VKRHAIIVWTALAVACCLVAACAAPITIVTPEGKKAWNADQAVLRIGEFQQAAIDANRAKAISDSTEVLILHATIGTAKILGAVNSDWRTVAKTALAALVSSLPQAGQKLLADIIADPNSTVPQVVQAAFKALVSTLSQADKDRFKTAIDALSVVIGVIS
jgi:hypothetical protein